MKPEKDGRTVLALDTSRLKGSVAVAREGDVLCELLFDASDTHSATLMPALETCMTTARTSIEEIDLLGVVTGPGSFTGLRIGMATIKALAAARNTPVAVAGTLETMAAAFPFAGPPVMPVLDARRGEIYAAVYDMSGERPVEIVPPSAVKPADAGSLARSAGIGAGGRLVMSGNGIERYGQVLQDVMPCSVLIAPRRSWDPSAAALAGLVLEREPVTSEELETLEPLYIRPPDAKLPGGTRLKEGGKKS